MEEETERRMALRRLKWKYDERVTLEICSVKVSELSITTPRSRTLEEKENSGNFSESRMKSSFWSYWGVPSQMN